jgi:S-methyl-5-thioribose-1-phosphate isomerase
MRVRVGEEVKEFRTVWREGRIIHMIDQRKLPHRFEIFSTWRHEETAEAIRGMVVRGAGAIGVAAAYGMAQAALEAGGLPKGDFKAYLESAADLLRSTRPTAVNLFHAVDRCLRAAEGPMGDPVMSVVSEADAIAEEDLEASRRIGEFGKILIPDGARILTHCNAGALAFIDYGTALSPIRLAHREGKRILVLIDETRPRLQGAMLTAWELEQEGIPHVVIVDNAAGYYMKRGEVDMVIVGADRVALNGDFANKIGTYEKAVLAAENGIPFYVAAPKMTFDPNSLSGGDIVVEERGGEEVRYVYGLNERGEMSRVLIMGEDTPVRNPAFDITPGDYVTGFITENGVLRPPYTETIPKFLGLRG